MLDRPARRLIDPALDRAAAVLVRAGVSANTVTVVGFALGIGACAAIAASSFRTALLLIALNRLADGLDGAVARRTRSTLLGGFLDILLDTLFYSGVPFAFALARPESALPAAFLVYAFVGTGGSFLAAAIVATQHGVSSERKSFHYSVGLMEGTETIAFFVAFCLVPDRFAELAWTFGTLCWITTALRIATTVVRFREAEPDPSAPHALPSEPLLRDAKASGGRQPPGSPLPQLSSCTPDGDEQGRSLPVATPCLLWPSTLAPRPSTLSDRSLSVAAPAENPT